LLMFWREGFRKQVPAQLGTSESNFSVKFAAEASRPSRFSGEAPPAIELDEAPSWHAT
jgi:hypothetical protein